MGQCFSDPDNGSNHLLFFLFWQKSGNIQFWEAECIKIDASNKKVLCRPNLNVNSEQGKDFFVDYDYLVVAMGARVNTFNTPGVTENCHFLKVNTGLQ